MDVSVIIVNYKTANLICDCVTSIIEKTREITYEVIVVDNDSEPDFEEKIKKSIPDNLFPSFKFIALNKNIGFGRANNEGLKIAKGRNIFFLNPDTLLLNNAIKILSDFLDNHKNVGACGGNLYDENEQPTLSYKMFLPGILWEINELFNNKPQEILYGKTKHFYNVTSKPVSVGYITGADLMVKKSILETTGSFSPEFFMYFEETDLCARIRKSGFKIYSVPSARILHLESKSFSGSEAYQSEFKTRLLEESRKIYYRRNFSKTGNLICNGIYNLFLTSRIKLIGNQKKKDYYKLRKSYFKR
ncbi:MAG: glycosyltransferase family 2 protein [Muribaculaceae bacterium]|nr:glycosyltransferase family 2 protein [Muribaculaceae bacterium]